MLVLASASPRRRDLLTQAGFVFMVDPANTPEDHREGETVEKYVCRIAEEKARAVFVRQSQIVEPDPALIVLGADTCVLLDERVLGKPSDAAEARTMLESLSGRTHEVLTGLAVVTRKGAITAVERTEVRFRTVQAQEMVHYLASGEPLDKSGGYGIQGYAARWIPSIAGCYFNVVGLPISRTIDLIGKATKQLLES